MHHEAFHRVFTVSKNVQRKKYVFFFFFFFFVVVVVCLLLLFFFGGGLYLYTWDHSESVNGIKLY